MNINIQKIMDESNLGEIIDDAYLDRGDWQSFVKEFAELIIKECGDVADDYVEHGIPSAAINKHFGIKP